MFLVENKHQKTPKMSRFHINLTTVYFFHTSISHILFPPALPFINILFLCSLVGWFLYLSLFTLIYLLMVVFLNQNTTILCVCKPTWIKRSALTAKTPIQKMLSYIDKNCQWIIDFQSDFFLSLIIMKCIVLI